MEQQQSGKWGAFKRSPWYAWKWLIASIVVVYLLVYMPTSYVIYTAGSAESVKPMVEVPNGDQQEEGSFMLTTVRRTNANLFLMAWHIFNDDAEYAKKSDSLQGRTEDEYMTELVLSMSGSQSNAILAAYNQVGVPYQIESKGVILIRNIDNVADNEFKTNDRIALIEGQEIQGIDDLRAAIKPYSAGDTLNITVEREGEMVDVKATLVTFVSSAEPDKTQVGFGSYYGEKKEVVATDPNKQVKFKESDIGGPSAGLMFTLELINQLTPGDLTQGKEIAGTGEITPEGTVGIIGGIKHKIVAADREGAVLFLVPEGNYADAKAKLDTMDSDMKLVSVKTLEDALQALEELE